jgi:hypothetical protein
MVLAIRSSLRAASPGVRAPYSQVSVVLFLTPSGTLGQIACLRFRSRSKIASMTSSGGRRKVVFRIGSTVLYRSIRPRRSWLKDREGWDGNDVVPLGL